MYMYIEILYNFKHVCMYVCMYVMNVCMCLDVYLRRDFGTCVNIYDMWNHKDIFIIIYHDMMVGSWLRYQRHWEK